MVDGKAVAAHLRLGDNIPKHSIVRIEMAFLRLTHISVYFRALFCCAALLFMLQYFHKTAKESTDHEGYRKMLQGRACSSRALYV
jgi:hypothetical protein